MSWDILPKSNLQYFLQKLKGKLDVKVDKVSGKDLSTNDYTTTEKNKLAGIESGAQVNPTIDSALSSTSTNAVQNKVVKSALDGKANKGDIPSVNNNTITIQLNGTTIESFTLNQSSNETINIQVTKSDVGLGNVGNYKAVSTVANQGLTDTEKSNSRANIGAGTSNFDGAYSSLSGKPTLGTASAKDVPSSGNASTSQVVMGNDTRLSDSRPASDVSSWAKASTKPTYTASEVGLGNVPNVSTNDQTPTFTEASIRANIASGEKLSVILGKIKKFFTDLKTVAFTGAYSDLTGKPTIPAAANNGTLTIKQNGTSKATFTANQSGNSTAELTDTKYTLYKDSSGIYLNGSDGTLGDTILPGAAETLPVLPTTLNTYAYANSELINNHTNLPTGAAVISYLNSNYCVYGNNTNGEYLKYDNGTLICWKRVVVSNVNITTAWGNCYESDRIQLGAPPHAFKTGTAPRTFLSTEDINAVFEAVQSKTATDFGNTRLWRPTQATGQSGAIYVFAIGNWK